ncbi:MAG: chromosome segregation protein SMC [Steroidobacteraceae bacterium]
MRLTKVKLAGFKSFVDPTTVNFPQNLTGVVGPNGCGKSNVIDAVRWVMGELSAKHLRGDSMTDVIFNGSNARKPVGSASVELVFDNSDGKITGAYANYNEVALKRAVSRDGSSAYYINGARCRRKDITTLFLGTGLGARSYAIIEQGMISRVIEARGEDMRAFVEEAAGISKYKERRKETESRVADTRENLERLQDLRDEVDKQIRHLTRQANVARKYQDFKNEEARLGAELLALRLRDIDSGAQQNDRAVRENDLRLQQDLAAQRSAEAALEKQREFQNGVSRNLAEVQQRYYEQGATVSRLEQSLQHSREVRESRRAEHARVSTQFDDASRQIERDRAEQERLAAEIATLTPDAAAAQEREQGLRAELEEAEQALQEWQQRWEAFNRQLGGSHQTTQVERARIEQLEDQLRRLAAQADRLAVEHEQLLAADAGAGLAALSDDEGAAREASEALSSGLSAVTTRAQELRVSQKSAEGALESARGQRERSRSELVSLEALQKAALGGADQASARWLKNTGLAERPRATTQLSVDAGWERAVETVLGDCLEAVCVDALDAASGALDSLDGGHVMLIESGGESGTATAPGPSLASHVRGPAAVLEQLAGVGTAADLAEALANRSSLGDGQSLVTPRGEWIGRHWLRIVRGGDAHAGMIEREQRLKQLRGALEQREAAVREAEAALAAVREALVATDRERETVQAQISAAHRRHAELRGQLEATRARAQQSQLRRERIARDGQDVGAEREKAQGSLERARAAFETASTELERLDGQRHEMETERESRRQATQQARTSAQTAQLRARELLIALEGRRTSHASREAGLTRLDQQVGQYGQRRDQLDAELRDADEPIEQLQQQLNDALATRAEVDENLAAARRDLNAADAELRALDERRVLAERHVGEAREALDAARLAAQESRVRREALVEQFTATRFDLEEVQGRLPEEAAQALWEENLARVMADIAKLGQVNLAAIDELKEQSERKTYLDAQWQDLTDALATLDDAMGKIDKETRTRFEDTFNRINSGLQEKFPRLFGGGHAYLELVGDDILTAGVAVMARPPGKRNVTINQLSGGEKALTAVALVFSIFDLNPAPFCLLDEVDAPLDEHNVGRFCDIVREMSQRVQFIFITHNKTTMELANQLVGVTMNEPGVSRMVAVDVDEAVRLAAV